MDTLPLPPRPDLEQYRKRAKALVAAANAGDPAAVKQWADDWLRALTKLLGVEITPFVQHSFDRAVEGIQKEVATRVTRAKSEGATFALADAQHLIAQAHSYDTWDDFTREIEGLRSDAGKSAGASKASASSGGADEMPYCGRCGGPGPCGMDG